MENIIERLGHYDRTTKRLSSKGRSVVIRFLEACNDGIVAEQIQFSYPLGKKWYSDKAVRAVYNRLCTIEKVTDPVMLISAVVTKLQHEGFHAPSRAVFEAELKERFYAVLRLKCIKFSGNVVNNIAQLIAIMSNVWFKSGNVEKIEGYASVLFDLTRFYYLIDSIVRLHANELNSDTHRITWLKIIKEILNVDFTR